jgi:hypothetical protein
MKNISNETWIGWVGAFVIAVAVTITFAYGEFETKEHAKDKSEAVVKRLDRMDDKLDQIILTMPQGKK